MFSTIIPVYNSQDTIVAVLDSVKNQTRLDLIEEVIIVNDGSLDNSLKVIEDYMRNNQSMNIILFNQENKGVSSARNVGIVNAKGEWLAFLDSDDMWLPNKIERQFEIIRENEKIVFLGALTSRKKFRVLLRVHTGIYKARIKDICWRSFPGNSTVVCKRSIAVELGGFDINMSYGEDQNFYQKFCMYYNYYILCEQLIELGIDKKYFAQKGLSSHLYEMHLGRNKCLKDVYDAGMISYFRYIFMLRVNDMKFLRRRIMQNINSLRKDVCNHHL